MLLVDTPPGDITGQGTSTAQAKGLFSLRNHVRESNPEALDLSGMASPFNQMHIDHTRYLKPPTTSRGLLQVISPAAEDRQSPGKSLPGIEPGGQLRSKENDPHRPTIRDK